MSRLLAIFTVLRMWLWLRVQHYRTRSVRPSVGQLWAGPKRTLLAICDVTEPGYFSARMVVFTKGMPERGQQVQSYEVPLAQWPEFVRQTTLAYCGEWAL